MYFYPWANNKYYNILINGHGTRNLSGVAAGGLTGTIVFYQLILSHIVTVIQTIAVKYFAVFISLVTMIEDTPILSINVKIWKFCSVILSHSWRRYAFVGPVAIMNAMQFVFLYCQWGDVSAFILNAFYAIAIFNSLLRTCLVIINRTRFEAFMMELAILYRGIEESNDQNAKDILKEATLGARKISIFNLSASFFDLIGAIMCPLFSQSKIHPYGVAIPGVNVTSSPIYEIIYVLQLSTPLVLTSMYMPFVSLFASYAMFGTAVLKIVQGRLRQVYSPTKSKDMVYCDLVACIKYYTRISRFVDDFNSLVTYIVFAEFLIFSTILCALLFCLNIIDSVMQIIAIIMYIMTMLYVLFTYYWQANELLTEIMVGNIYPMTLETFQSLLNASYSYFTILRGVYK